MRRWTRTVALATVSLLVLAVVAAAQNAPKAPQLTKPLIPLKVDVVFNEYEGTKLVSRLPYTLSVNANDKARDRQSSLRIGLGVPFRTGGNQFQYHNVGTEIDCSAHTVGADLVEVSLGLRRSFVYSSQRVGFHGASYEFYESGQKLHETPEPGSEGRASAVPLGPVFSHFSTNLNLIMRNGQTIQSTMATDPISGHVLKVDVTLHVVKD